MNISPPVLLPCTLKMTVNFFLRSLFSFSVMFSHTPYTALHCTVQYRLRLELRGDGGGLLPALRLPGHYLLLPSRPCPAPAQEFSTAEAYHAAVMQDKFNFEISILIE